MINPQIPQVNLGLLTQGIQAGAQLGGNIARRSNELIQARTDALDRAVQLQETQRKISRQTRQDAISEEQNAFNRRVKEVELQKIQKDISLSGFNSSTSRFNADTSRLRAETDARRLDFQGKVEDRRVKQLEGGFDTPESDAGDLPLPVEPVNGIANKYNISGKLLKSIRDDFSKSRLDNDADRFRNDEDGGAIFKFRDKSAKAIANELGVDFRQGLEITREIEESINSESLPDTPADQGSFTPPLETKGFGLSDIFGLPEEE